MSKALVAFDFLLQEQVPRAPIYVLFGDDEYLKRLCLEKIRRAILGREDADLGYRALEGGQTAFAEVEMELSTLSMFADGPRVVVVTDADRFVSQSRPQLERLLESPPASGILVLILDQFPSNTRLFAAAAKSGIVVDCGVSKKKPAEIAAWLSAWAAAVHGLRLQKAAAEMLVELVGTNPGTLDQELQKLSQSGTTKSITPEMVSRTTGTWRTKAVWDILNAALDGRTADALQELDLLFQAGETPLGVLGMLSATLRRYAMAAYQVGHPHPGRPRLSLQQALKEAGVPPFALKNEEARLRRLGRKRAERLLDWLCELDLAMKGGSATDPRILLDRFICLLGQGELADFRGRFLPL
ncbi:MAG: DNA polymerase III subunit delta [Thermogutta sp.]|nr:DNA polymerase III subunit delta [Thermogutta sp.]